MTDVLTRLEDGVKNLNLTSDARCDELDLGDVRFAAPPTAHPLSPRDSALKRHGCLEDEQVAGHLVTRYGCVVLDAPLYNAWSIGFGSGFHCSPDHIEEAPGVVCVYSGLLDEIMRGRQQDLNEADASAGAQVLVTSPNPIVGLFLFSTMILPYSGIRSATPPEPTAREDEELAAVLAHELSHLLLPHTIETLTSERLCTLLATLFVDRRFSYKWYNALPEQHAETCHVSDPLGLISSLIVFWPKFQRSDRVYISCQP